MAVQSYVFLRTTRVGAGDEGHTQPDPLASLTKNGGFSAFSFVLF